MKTLVMMFIALMVGTTVIIPNAQAQVFEAMGTNWDNAGRLYKLIVEAFDAGKQEEVVKLTIELRDNLDHVEQKLNHVGQRLHDKDKNWPWLSRKESAVLYIQRARTAAGLLGSTAKNDGLVKAASDFRDFKDKYSAFVDMMNALRMEFQTHGEELTHILKAFREECSKCIP